MKTINEEIESLSGDNGLCELISERFRKLIEELNSSRTNANKEFEELSKKFDLKYNNDAVKIESFLKHIRKSTYVVNVPNDKDFEWSLGDILEKNEKVEYLLRNLRSLNQKLNKDGTMKFKREG